MTFSTMIAPVILSLYREKFKRESGNFKGDIMSVKKELFGVFNAGMIFGPIYMTSVGMLFIDVSPSFFCLSLSRFVVDLSVWNVRMCR